MITQIFLFIFGLLFIWIGLNSLSKLKENNQKWREIEKTYIVPNDVYYEKRKETFEEAKQLVKKFQKYIPILSNMSIFCGILSLLGIFLINQNYNFNLTYIGYASFVIFIIGFASFVVATNNDGAGFIDVLIRLNTKYNLLINLFLNSDKFIVENIQDLFGDYIRNNFEAIFSVTAFGKYRFCSNNWYINERIFLLFSLYLGIFLFLIAFIFDKNFYQMIISFN